MTSFKKLVYDHCGVPPDEQRLIFAGKELDDDKNLGDYSTLRNRATLFLVLRLHEGFGDSYQKYFDHHHHFPGHANCLHNTASPELQCRVSGCIKYTFIPVCTK